MTFHRLFQNDGSDMLSCFKTGKAGIFITACLSELLSCATWITYQDYTFNILTIK